jgi:hypothetical protein
MGLVRKSAFLFTGNSLPGLPGFAMQTYSFLSGDSQKNFPLRFSKLFFYAFPDP